MNERPRPSGQSTQKIAKYAARMTRAYKSRHPPVPRLSRCHPCARFAVPPIYPVCTDDRGIELLERVVAMQTKLIDPGTITASATPTGAFPCTCTATITGATTSTIGA